MTDTISDTTRRESDNYGFFPDTPIRDLISVWPELCREIFVQRYAQWPDAAKLPLEDIWEGVWQGVVTGPSIIMVRAPATQRYGMLTLPQQYQEARSCGFIASVGPMLMFPQVLERCAYAPMFDHPLDLIGKCYLFQPYQGVVLKAGITSKSGMDAMVLKVRIEDLHMELHELDLRDGSERLTVPAADAPPSDPPTQLGPSRIVLP